MFFLLYLPFARWISIPFAGTVQAAFQSAMLNFPSIRLEIEFGIDSLTLPFMGSLLI